MSGLREVLSSTDKPLMVKAIVVMAVCGAAAGVVAWPLGTGTLGLSVLVGFMLGFIVASVPMVLALSLIAVNGLLLALAAALGVAVVGHPLAGALVMAVLALLSAVWMAIPIVGPFFAGLPILVYVLMAAKGQELIGSTPAPKAGIAALAGLVGAAIVAVLVSIRDPRKPDRTLTAAVWKPETPVGKLAMIVRVLFLDAAPRPWQVLAAQASVVAMCRKAVSGSGDEYPEAAAAAEQASATVAAAIVPRGAPTPRTVTFDLSAVDEAARQADGRVGAAWQLWSATLTQAQRVLAGEASAPVHRHPMLTLLAALVRSILRPDVALFRYGLQRAIALGIGMGALIYYSGNENVFWVVLTLVSVLQINASATVTRLLQRLIGTLVGVLAAVIIALVLPKEILVPYLAGLVLLVGVVWMMRNYAVTSMCMAFAVVLMIGAPDDRVLTFAGLRALDVAIGGVIALVVTWVIFPVRPRPGLRRTSAVSALRAQVVQLQAAVHAPGKPDFDALIAKQAAALTSVSNYASEVLLLPEAQRSAHQADVDVIDSAGEEAFVLSAVVVGLAGVPITDSEVLHDSLDQLDAQLEHLAKSGV